MDSYLVIISKDVIRRNILDTEFWPEFISLVPSNKKIILVVNDEDISDFNRFKAVNVEVVSYQKKRLYGLQGLLDYLIRTSIDSHSTRTYRNRALARKQCSWMSYILKACIANTLGSNTQFKRFLRFLFLKTSGEKDILRIFDRYQPKLVFTPSMIDNAFDAQFAKVARQKNIKLVGMVRSWDNLNNHGLLSVVPDVFYFQNRFLVEAAGKFQAIDVNKLQCKVVGLPHYDNYYDPDSFLVGRQDFCDSMGLDPDKKIVLLGGSDFYYSEDRLPKIIDNFVEERRVPALQVVFRPHTGSVFDIADYNLETCKHIRLDDALKDGKLNDTNKFINLLHHSDLIINIASTLSIDAAVFDKPAICINFDDPKKNLSKYEKTTALYTHFDHYERLVEQNSVFLPESIAELASSINLCLKDPSIKSEGRRKVIEEFVSPYDGKAGRRLAQYLASEL